MTHTKDNTPDTFQWNDELVKEYGRQFGYAGEPDIEEFKRNHSKQLPIGSKDYEILTAKSKNGDVHDYIPEGNEQGSTPCLKMEEPCTIHSVRRISDGEVLTVGSKEFSYGKPCEILSFRIMPNCCMWCNVKFEDGSIYENANIFSLDKLPTPTQLSTDSEDKVFDGKRVDRFINDEFGQWGKIKPLRFSSPKKYTQKEVDTIREEAFNAGRNCYKVQIPNGGLGYGDLQFKYKDFQDYLNTINNKQSVDTGKDKDSTIGIDWYGITQQARSYKNCIEASEYLMNQFHIIKNSIPPSIDSNKGKEDNPILDIQDKLVNGNSDVIWFVNPYWELHSKVKNTHHPADNDKNITVKDREAGKQYILENKPCLSLNDLLEAWTWDNNLPKHTDYKNSPLYMNFERKAKQKLNL